jgi:uncharacterized protein
LLNRIALNPVKNEQSRKRSVKDKSFDAGWNNDYLLNILTNFDAAVLNKNTEKYCNSIILLIFMRLSIKTVIDNVNNIAQIIPNVHIVLRINHDKQTLKHIRDIIKDISEESKTHIEVDFQRVWQVPFTEKDIDLLKDTKEFFLSNGLKSNFWAYRPQIFIRCYADRLHHYAINYDGRVFKCTARDYGNDKVIGNLLPNGRIEWNDKLLSVFFSKSTFENERCMKCNMLPVCMGPCIQKNYDSLINNTPLPCVIENAEYTLSSYIIEQAKKRNLMN